MSVIFVRAVKRTSAIAQSQGSGRQIRLVFLRGRLVNNLDTIKFFIFFLLFSSLLRHGCKEPHSGINSCTDVFPVQSCSTSSLCSDVLPDKAVLPSTIVPTCFFKSRLCIRNCCFEMFPSNIVKSSSFCFHLVGTWVQGYRYSILAD